MTQYQLIFRHLFELKYVERQLNGVWQVLQATRGLFRWGVMNSPCFLPCYFSGTLRCKCTVWYQLQCSDCYCRTMSHSKRAQPATFMLCAQSSPCECCDGLSHVCCMHFQGVMCRPCWSWYFKVYSKGTPAAGCDLVLQHLLLQSPLHRLFSAAVQHIDQHVLIHHPLLIAMHRTPDSECGF